VKRARAPGRRRRLGSELTADDRLPFAESADGGSCVMGWRRRSRRRYALGVSPPLICWMIRWMMKKMPYKSRLLPPKRLNTLVLLATAISRAVQPPPQRAAGSPRLAAKIVHRAGGDCIERRVMENSG